MLHLSCYSGFNIFYVVYHKSDIVGKLISEHYVIYMYLYVASEILSIPSHFYLIYIDTYIVAYRQTGRQIFYWHREKSSQTYLS